MEESKSKFLQNFPIPNKASGKTKNQNLNFDLKSKLERVFDENYIDNPFIDDIPGLSQQENRLRKEIIMQEAKEKCREENPELYKKVLTGFRSRKTNATDNNSSKSKNNSSKRFSPLLSL